MWGNAYVIHGMIRCQHDIEIPFKNDNVACSPTAGNLSRIPGSVRINNEIISETDMMAQQKYALPCPPFRNIKL